MSGIRFAGLLGTVAVWLALGPPPSAASVPTVSSGARPGPDVLYAGPAQAPQLENASPWQAPPILVSGAAAYRDGEFLYQDFLYDDHGAAGVRDPEDPFDPATFLFSAKRGTLTYPTDKAFANNAADLVELRVKPLGDATAFRVTLNSLADPARTAFTIALGSSGAPVPWPHGAGVSSPAELFLTVHGTTAELRDAATSALKSPAPSVSVDTRRRQFEVRVPHAAWNPGASQVRMAAGVGLWNPGSNTYLAPNAGAANATTPGGRAASGAAIFNLAFRFDEPLPDVYSNPAPANTFVEGGAGYTADAAWWRERAQADALATGDVSQFNAVVDFGRLFARANDDSGVPKTGHFNRILASRHSFGQGVDHDKGCFIPNPPVCEGRFLGQLQPYAVYVPARPRPSAGYGLTFLLHGLSANHNEFVNSRHARQFGDRGAGSILAAPYGRGPDGFYRDFPEADFFEVWSDVARHYDLDPSWVTISGYSMGGTGTFRLAARWPDLFARMFPIVGYGGHVQDQLHSLRNVPLFFWNAGQDELVNPALYEPTRIALDEAGVAYEHWVFNPAGHITIGSNDEFGPAAAFLGDHRVNRDPPHVTYVVDTADDNRSAGVVADHAYWLSDLRVRGGARGTIDALSLAFGVGDPPRSDLQVGGGALQGGKHGPLPYVSRARSWGRGPSIARANRLDVNVTNLRSGTLDARRARLRCDADVRIRSDGPFSLRIAGCDRVASFGCLSRRSPIGPRNIGRIRLGRTRRQMLRVRVQPRRRTPRTYRYCVKRSRGRVTAVFQSRSRRARARLVTSTARLHRKGRVGRGARFRSTMTRTFPRRRRIGHGLYRASPRSRRIVGVRRGRVRFIGVADRRVLRNRRALRRYLRKAGLVTRSGRVR